MLDTQSNIHLMFKIANDLSGDLNTGIYFPSADTIAFTEGGTEAMRITTDGRLGIGTTAPRSKLSVTNGLENTSGDAPLEVIFTGPNQAITSGNGILTIQSNDNINSNVGATIALGGRIRSTGTTTDASNFAVLKGAKENATSDNSAGYFAISTKPNALAPVERMRITSGGGVNIGSSVLSAGSTDGDIVASLGIVIGTFNGNNRIASSSLGGGTATLFIGNAAIQVSSDRRLKTNIINTTMSAIDKIKQVRIVDFNWNDPNDTSYNNRNARGTWTGIIAQELIDVFSFAVNAPRKEEDLSVDNESENKWQVDLAHLVPVLMKAIQEQQTIIEQLEATSTSQQTKIDALEARLTALENK